MFLNVVLCNKGLNEGGSISDSKVSFMYMVESEANSLLPSDLLNVVKEKLVKPMLALYGKNVQIATVNIKLSNPVNSSQGVRTEFIGEFGTNCVSDDSPSLYPFILALKSEALNKAAVERHRLFVFLLLHNFFQTMTQKNTHRLKKRHKF